MGMLGWLWPTHFSCVSWVRGRQGCMNLVSVREGGPGTCIWAAVVICISPLAHHYVLDLEAVTEYFIILCILAEYVRHDLTREEDGPAPKRPRVSTTSCKWFLNLILDLEAVTEYFIILCIIAEYADVKREEDGPAPKRSRVEEIFTTSRKWLIMESYAP